MEGSLVAYKVFTNGSVLQASEINDNLMRQSVMVFSNAAARTAAITVPLEGMLTWLEDTNAYQFYNGSAWTNLLQTSGLELIKVQTIGTAVTSVNVTAAFNSTYDNYKIVVTGGVGSAAVAIQMRLGASTTGYSQAVNYANYSGAAALLQVSNGSQFSFMGEINTNFMAVNADIISPNLVRQTQISSAYVGGGIAGFSGGNHAVAAAYTDFTLLPASGNMTGGTIFVYGYRKTI
jgi:hypothetical protein